MSSFLWLLLYLAPLLGVTALAFAWLGWQWRRTTLLQSVGELETRVEALHKDRASGEAELNDLRRNKTTAEESGICLRREAEAAHEDLRRHQAEADHLRAAQQSLQSDLARMQQDLEALRADNSKLAADLAAAHAEVARLSIQASAAPAVEIPAPQIAPVPLEIPATTGAERTLPPKRTRATAAKAKPTAKRGAGLEQTLARVETEIAEHLASAASAGQERDDLVRRIAALKGQPVADSAALDLATRTLAECEKHMQTSSDEVARLQNHQRVLRRIQDQAPALAAVPDDDLTRIKGIKSVINEQLRTHGIRTWQQIARWDDEDLRAFSELLAFKNRATREKWKEQAQALHQATHGQLPL